jgi:hypothetical protein
MFVSEQEACVDVVNDMKRLKKRMWGRIKICQPISGFDRSILQKPGFYPIIS